MKELSRRRFVEGAGAASLAAVAVGLVGCGATSSDDASSTAESVSSTAKSTSSESMTATTASSVWDIPELGEPTEVYQADVAIVGAGGTGTAAALQAIDEGLKPMIMERLGGYGGSFIGTEGMTAIDTEFTEGAGVDYTVKEAVQNCLDYHHWIPQHDLYTKYFNQTKETIPWLESKGIEFEGLVQLGLSPNIWHVYDKGEDASPGGHFMSIFGKAAEDAGVEAVFNCFARKIVMEDGKVAGIIGEKEDGTVVKIEAPVVMIGAGGYANNLDMLYEVSETKNENIQPLGMDCRNGDGLKMAKDAGASFAEGLGTVMWCGPVPIGAIKATWTTDTYTLGVQPTLWVNQHGKRFCREDLWAQNFAAAGICIRNQDRTFMIVTDDQISDMEANGPWATVFSFGPVGSPLVDARKDLDGLDSVHIGTDIEALAEKAGIDAETLVATVAEYNEMCKAAEGADAEDVAADDAFGKQAQYMHGLDDGSNYYLIEVADGYYTTCGGIKVNENIEVIDMDDQVIPGLYAGGSDAGGLYGDSYDVVWAPGSQAGWAVNSGRLAMKNAAKYLA